MRTRRWCSKHAGPEQLVKKLGVSIEPGAERKTLGGSTPCGGLVGLVLHEHEAHTLGQRLRRRRFVSIPSVGVGNAYARLVSDKLDGAAT